MAIFTGEKTSLRRSSFRLGIVTAALLFGACSSSSGGPIDGNYTITSEAACGTDQGLTPTTATITNTTGTSASTAADGCVASGNLAFTYPSSTTLTYQVTTVTCSAQCVNGDCTASTTPQAATTYNYTLVGNTLTLTQPLTCPNGQGGTFTEVMTKH